MSEFTPDRILIDFSEVILTDCTKITITIPNQLLLNEYDRIPIRIEPEQRHGIIEDAAIMALGFMKRF